MKRLLTILAAACLMTGAAYADIWEDLAKYKMGDALENPLPVQVEALITKTPLDERVPVEEALIKIVESKNSTPEAKWFCCRMLQRVGTEKCVPTLAALLADEEMSHFARLALQRMTDSEKAGEALRNALGKATDNLKPGIIGSIAERRDRKAVRQISKLTASEDLVVAGAALQALGKIGGKRAKKAIEGAKVAADLKAAKLDALLVYAEGAADAETFKYIYVKVQNDTHRAAALRGLLVADEEQGVPIVLELLKGDDSYLRGTALRLVAISPSEKLTKAVASELSEYGVDKKAEIVSLLGERGDRAALDSVGKCLRSDDRGLREAAIVAVGLLGDADCVKPLLKQACDADYNQKAIESIAAMTGRGVNGALTDALKDGGVKAPAIQAIARRNVFSALPEVKKLTGDPNAGVRKAAWEGLGDLASEDDLEPLMRLMIAIQDDGEKKIARTAMKDTCSRAPDKNACMDVVGSYYGKSDESAKLFILEVAALAGGPKALDLTRKALKSGEKTLYDKAVRTLSSWPTDAAAPDLLDLAENAPDQITRLLSLKGYIQVAAKSGDNRKKVERLKAAKNLVTRVDEKRLLIKALKDTKRPEALKILTGYLDDAQVKAEAQRAAVDMAKNLSKNNPEEVAAAMKIILKDAEANKSVLEKARDYYDKTSKEESRKRR